MKEISLHILDIVQNSLNAGASTVSITIVENEIKNLFEIEIRDNGSGIDKHLLKRITDPFYTSKGKKTGLGIPLLKQHAEMTGGHLIIESEEGKGTLIKAVFERNHIDRQPLGNIKDTIISLVRSNPATDFSYVHKMNRKKFQFSTHEIRNELQGIPVNTPEVLKFIADYIEQKLKDIGVG